jgi:hypothetical protein
MICWSGVLVDDGLRYRGAADLDNYLGTLGFQPEKSRWTVVRVRPAQETGSGRPARHNEAE